MPWNKRLTFLWFIVSVAATVAITAVLWIVFDLPVLLGFLVLPFLFYGAKLFGGRAQEPDEPHTPRRTKTCSRCGWQTTEPDDRYCPRDAQPLD